MRKIHISSSSNCNLQDYYESPPPQLFVSPLPSVSSGVVGADMDLDASPDFIQHLLRLQDVSKLLPIIPPNHCLSLFVYDYKFWVYYFYQSLYYAYLTICSSPLKFVFWDSIDVIVLMKPVRLAQLTSDRELSHSCLSSLISAEWTQ